MSGPTQLRELPGCRPYIVRVSSSPAARGTRAERGVARADGTARRAIPEADAAATASDASVGGSGSQTVVQDRPRVTLHEPERQLLTSLALTVAVVVFITVILPVLISLVRNF